MIKKMARRPIRPIRPKLKRLKIDGTLWDGYRGNKHIVWSGFYDEEGFMIEEFAIECKCGAWYGWVKGVTTAKKVYKRMQKSGCKECKS
jgi:hypothetical protein